MNVDLDKLRAFAEGNGIRFAVLFGSHANGTSRDDSDFDIGIYFNDPKDFWEKYGDLLDFFCGIFNVNEDKIDLTDLRTDNILLRHEITRDGKLLFGNEEDYLELQSFAYRDFVDAESLFNLEHAMTRMKINALKKELRIA